MEVEVNKDNYQQEVVEHQTPTVVDFWGPKCVRCLELMPTMEALAEAHREEMRLVKVDSSKNRRLCMGLRLMSLPAFIFYRDGQEVGRISGNDLTEEDLQKAVDDFLAGQEINPASGR
jgi:thioredoxin 1